MTDLEGRYYQVPVDGRDSQLVTVGPAFRAHVRCFSGACLLLFLWAIWVGIPDLNSNTAVETISFFGLMNSKNLLTASHSPTVIQASNNYGGFQSQSTQQIIAHLPQPRWSIVVQGARDRTTQSKTPANDNEKWSFNLFQGQAKPAEPKKKPATRFQSAARKPPREQEKRSFQPFGQAKPVEPKKKPFTIFQSSARKPPREQENRPFNPFGQAKPVEPKKKPLIIRIPKPRLGVIELPKLPERKPLIIRVPKPPLPKLPKTITVPKPPVPKVELPKVEVNTPKELEDLLQRFTTPPPKRSEPRRGRDILEENSFGYQLPAIKQVINQNLLQNVLNQTAQLPAIKQVINQDLLQTVLNQTAQEVSSPQNIEAESIVYSPSANPMQLQWLRFDDIVTGSNSPSSFVASTGVWRGVVEVSTQVRSVGIRTRLLDPPLDLGRCDGLVLKVKGGGQRFKFIIRDDDAFDGVAWAADFDTSPFFDTEVKLNFADFQPIKRLLAPGTQPILNISSITGFQFSYNRWDALNELNPTFKAGEYALEIKEIAAYVDFSIGDLLKSIKLPELNLFAEEPKEQLLTTLPPPLVTPPPPAGFELGGSWGRRRATGAESSGTAPWGIPSEDLNQLEESTPAPEKKISKDPVAPPPRTEEPVMVGSRTVEAKENVAKDLEVLALQSKETVKAESKTVVAEKELAKDIDVPAPRSKGSVMVGNETVKAKETVAKDPEVPAPRIEGSVVVGNKTVATNASGSSPPLPS